MCKRILRLFFIFLFLFLIRKFAIQPFRVSGPSMEPTLKDNQIVLVNKLPYHFRKPLRGEIILFRTTEEPPLYFIKRVVGLEGERIEFKDGKVYVNGKLLNEPYVVYNDKWNVRPIKVKKNCVFVVGDNRAMPAKFHLFTQVSLKNIIGKVLLK